MGSSPVDGEMATGISQKNAQAAPATSSKWQDSVTATERCQMSDKYIYGLYLSGAHGDRKHAEAFEDGVFASANSRSEYDRVLAEKTEEFRNKFNAQRNTTSMKASNSTKRAKYPIYSGGPGKSGIMKKTSALNTTMIEDASPSDQSPSYKKAEASKLLIGLLDELEHTLKSTLTKASGPNHKLSGANKKPLSMPQSNSIAGTAQVITFALKVLLSAFIH